VKSARHRRHVGAFDPTACHAHRVDHDQPPFRVTYVAPSGYKYELTGNALSEVEAVGLADETLEYVERIGISDHLRDDAITVRPPAGLQVERIQPDGVTRGFGLVITAPERDREAEIVGACDIRSWAGRIVRGMVGRQLRSGMVA
jgi:hypothetical protein